MRPSAKVNKTIRHFLLLMGILYRKHRLMSPYIVCEWIILAAFAFGLIALPFWDGVGDEEKVDLAVRVTFTIA